MFQNLLKLILFAYATNAFCSHNSLTEFLKMVIHNWIYWLRANRLLLKVKILYYLLFHPSKKKTRESNIDYRYIKIDGRNIGRVDKAKLLNI